MNETMHILAAFMMLMSSSGGTMEGEGWDSGVMVVGNRGGACDCLFVSPMAENLRNVKQQLRF